MKIREINNLNVLGSHTFVPSKDDPAGLSGEFLRRAPINLPADAEAVIYRPAKSAMTSGRAGLRRWILEFKPRSPLFIEPLMGWTGGTDPLAQVRLSFPSREAAAAFAGRHGLRFTVWEPHERRQATRSYADNFPAEPADPILLAAWESPAPSHAQFDDALVDPSRVFHGPREVAEHPLLTEREKREVLQRWLWDARLIETAVAEGMPDGGEPSRLDEVLDALARLDASAARPQAAADSAPRLRVPPDALRRSHSSSPMSFRDAVGKPTASQPAVGGLGTEKERFGGPWMSRSESGHDGAYRQRPDLSQDGEVPSRFASFRRRLRHGLRSPMLRAFRQIGAAANAVVGAVRTLLSRWAERWRAWREERRSLAELARLDDRCLEDIGLRRIRTSAGGEVIVPILDDSWTATARSAANDNARSDGTKVPTRRAA